MDRVSSFLTILDRSQFPTVAVEKDLDKTLARKVSMRYAVFMLIAIVFCSVATGQDEEGLRISRYETQRIRDVFQKPIMLDEFELVEDQRKEIKAAFNVFHDAVREMRDLKGKQRMGFFADAEDRLAEKILNEILLPHQRNRFAQVLNQQRIVDRAGSYAEFVVQDLSEELELTNDQIEALKKERAKNKKVMFNAVRKLQKQMEMQLAKEREFTLQQLTAKQREALERRIGDKFVGRGIGSVLNDVVFQYSEHERELETAEKRKKREGKKP